MQFERILKRRHAIALAFGAMIGWSWVLLSGLWIARAGTLGAAIAFVVVGIAMLLIALTYAELAAAMPQTGGEHVYSERAFGRGLCFVCSWALLLGYVSVIAFEVVALPFALSYLFPAINVGKLWQVAGWEVYAGQVAVGIGAAIVMTLINARGLASAASLQGFVTSLVVIVGVVLISGASVNGSPANFQPLFVDGVAGILSVMVMVPLLFVGFDVIPQAAEEIDLPPDRIGALVVVSVLCGTAWYVLIILAVGFALDDAGRATTTLTTAAAAEAAWAHSAAGTLLVCGGIAGIVTTWNAFLVGASRLVYVLAESNMLPAWLNDPEQRQHAPTRALWVICAISCCAPWFGRPALVWLLDAGSVGVLVAYALVALAFLVLRRREPDMPRPYRVRHGRAVGVAALVMVLSIASVYLPWSPSALVWPQEWAICASWIVLGGCLYRYSLRHNAPTT